MGYKTLLSVALFILTGCASTGRPNTSGTYDQYYQKTVKEEVGMIADDFKGGTFPYAHWNAPIVQEVHVPAQVKNGSFIPEHQELVMIVPGEWARNQAYPISQQKEHYAKPNEEPHIHDIDDITAVPHGNSGNGINP